MNENTLEKMLAALTPELVEAFRLAIEIGKWPDGRRLTDEQRSTCLQAVIAWEHKHLPEEQRIGYIDKGEKEGEVCDDPAHSHEEPVKFLH
ncbi:MAG TPA: DUF1315 family protein [Moraxellaceae bacterium]